MMLKITDDLTINPAMVASLETTQYHYVNGPGDASLIITMENGTRHVVKHGWGINIYEIQKKIEAA